MTSTSRETPLSPLILLCLAATWLIWGSTYLAIKWALVSLPPFFQMGTRFLLAGAVLMACGPVIGDAPQLFRSHDCSPMLLRNSP